MATSDKTLLPHVSDLVHIELAGYLPATFVITEVASEFLPGPDGDDQSSVNPVMIVAKTRIGGHPNVKLTGALESNPLISGLTEYQVRTTVIFEDGHPELDARTLNKCSLHIAPLCTEQGFDRPTIAYANRSEIPE